MIRTVLAFAAAIMLVGCSTTQDVTLAKAGLIKPIVSVAQVAEDGNSPQMDSNLLSALQMQKLTVRASFPKGTRTAEGVDALVSYVDVWRWDLAMYMKNLTVKLHDAQSGDLLAIAHWADSPLHGFRDAKAAMETLVAEMFAKLKASMGTPAK
ncbi:MAG: hypothetical protein AB7K73_16415 [Gammaproteobacteria bacterium]